MIKALYVHVPFCEQICHYCDFNKFFLANQPVDEYLDLCETEMRNTVKAFSTEGLSSIYVGGGTPTSLNVHQLEKLLNGVKANFPLAPKYEWTVEVNPGSADSEKFKMMNETGVNRLSIGAQTFDEALLNKIGRDHRPEQVEETIAAARAAGITNISVDLMFGLPGQTLEQFRETLEKAVALPIDHVSAYSLKVEEKTVFYQLWRKGKLPLPGEDAEAEMYEELRKYMLDAGFHQYEISNFAKPGFESSHNLTYWQNEEYYGIGAGAHSYTAGTRRINHGPLPKYMNAVKESGFPYREEHEVTLKEKMEEEMFMGLRKLAGVSKQLFKDKYSREISEVFPLAANLTEKGLLEEDEDTFRLTEKGLLLGNEVFEGFLLSDD
ncbi:radical SAM family heme chaperone HemW [Evansella clarkii]|uniref:radical SAM family heme chaperone HemW n=1 Tax=Evansella clarkii TaxID=79879 RepID=UPI0009985727|nr:radical SAM family heme chaperone HemW [Evansella clarkii]